MKKTILSLLVLSTIVYSCKKDKDKSTSDLIQGKWNVTTIYENRFYSNTTHRDTATYAAGVETIECASGGKVYYAGVYGSGTTYRDTGVFKIDGSNLILDVQDTFKINSISSSDMQLYSKNFYNATDYDEQTVNLKK